MRGLIIFLAGAAIGAGATYYFVNSDLQKKCNEEIEEIKEHYKEKLEQITGDKKAEKSEPKNKPDVVFKSGMDKINENYISHSKDPEVPSEGEDTDDILPDEEEYENVAPVEPAFDGPHIISEEEFSTECMNFEKYSYIFYLGDQTLVDEDGVVIDEDAPNTVGTEFMNILDAASDTIYIRNENITMDFEIVAESGNYYNNEEFVEEDE